MPNRDKIILPIPFGLTRFGFKKDIITQQEHLDAINKEPFNFKSVQRAQAFAIELLDKSLRVNKKHSSYGLKHLVERFLVRHFGLSANTYVGNGDFILAMYLSKFKITMNKDSIPNCFFNISETSILNAETYTFGVSENVKIKFQEEGIYHIFL